MVFPSHIIIYSWLRRGKNIRARSRETVFGLLPSLHWWGAEGKQRGNGKDGLFQVTVAVNAAQGSCWEHVMKGNFTFLVTHTASQLLTRTASAQSKALYFKPLSPPDLSLSLATGPKWLLLSIGCVIIFQT